MLAPTRKEIEELVKKKFPGFKLYICDEDQTVIVWQGSKMYYGPNTYLGLLDLIRMIEG